MDSLFTPIVQEAESFWNTVKTDVKAFEDTAKTDIAQFEKNFVPIIRADLEAFIGKYAGFAVQLVAKFAQAEFNALTGNEKQSNVIDSLVQTAEAEGHSFTSDLRVMAQTTAQQAYTTMAETIAANSAVPPTP